jgi:hypothetical protein
MQYAWLIRAGLLVGGIVAARRVALAIEVERRRIDAFVRTELHATAQALGVEEPVLQGSAAVEDVKLHGHYLFVNRAWAKDRPRALLIAAIARELARRTTNDPYYVIGRALARAGLAPEDVDAVACTLGGGKASRAALERGFWAHKPYSLT